MCGKTAVGQSGGPQAPNRSVSSTGEVLDRLRRQRIYPTLLQFTDEDGDAAMKTPMRSNTTKFLGIGAVALLGLTACGDSPDEEAPENGQEEVTEDEGTTEEETEEMEDTDGEASEDDADAKTKKSGDSKETDAKEEKKSTESWWDYAKYEIIGLSRPDEVSDKKDQDKKDADALKAKATKDPDSIFAISIRRVGKSKGARKEESTVKSEQHDDTASRSGSDDAVLVSKDTEDVTVKGPTKRTRTKKA